MGCDIHMGVEVRRDGVWTARAKMNTEYPGEHYREWEEPYDGRNYDLFAILANVRNGRGFAGILTGGGFNPIAEPRGIPEDASPEYRDWAGEMGGDGHSHSWFTVAELMAYDWTQITSHRGYVSNCKEFARWKYQGKPSGWSGDISGPGIVKKTASQVVAAWEQLGKPNLWDETTWRKIEVLCDAGAGRLVVDVQWTEPYYESASEFLSSTLPKLWRLGAYDDVRIVFFFDN